MTPKEKAQQLVDKFKPHSYNGAIEESDKLMELYHAKQCALIAVDEIIRASFYSTDEIYNFYIEVKIEIENL